jgi:PAS domain S-box-containing protein
LVLPLNASAADFPPDERARLAVLHGLGIVDTPPEEAYDAIVSLASELLAVPIALISLVDRDRQWFKASVGLPGVASTPRDVAFCAHAILSREGLVVPDATLDARFAANPLVTGDPRIRFYAGAPLITSDGHALGTLCAIDREPRVPGAGQLAALRRLAAIVSALIEARADRHALLEARADIEARERRLRTIADGIPASIGYIDRDQRVQYVNARAVRRRPDRAPAEETLREFLGAERYAQAEPYVARALAGERVSHQRVERDGDHATHTEVTYVPDADATGRVVGFFKLAYDVTARVEQDAALRRSEARLQSMFVAMAEGIVLQAPDGRIIDANHAAERLLGLSRDELLGRRSIDPAWRAIREDGSDFPGTEHPAMVTLRTGEPQRDVIMGVRYASEDPRWIRINTQPLPRGADAEVALVCTFVDVTEERAAVGRLRALTQRLETVREDERRSVALRLHEGVAQDLFALKLSLVRFDRALGDAALRAEARELMTTIEQAMVDLRELANDLRPAALAHARLPDAIAAHARWFSPLCGMEIDVAEEQCIPEVDEATRLLLFRAAQEALTNAARHGRAPRVEIRFRVIDEHVRMTVEDDGVGFEADALRKPGSLGLLGLDERLRSLGGALTITSRPGIGTRLVVQVRVASDAAVDVRVRSASAR